MPSFLPGSQQAPGHPRAWETLGALSTPGRCSHPQWHAQAPGDNQHPSRHKMHCTHVGPASPPNFVLSACSHSHAMHWHSDGAALARALVALADTRAAVPERARLPVEGRARAQRRGPHVRARKRRPSRAFPSANPVKTRMCHPGRPRMRGSSRQSMTARHAIPEPRAALPSRHPTRPPGPSTSKP